MPRGMIAAELRGNKNPRNELHIHLPNLIFCDIRFVDLDYEVSRKFNEGMSKSSPRKETRGVVVFHVLCNT